MTSWSSRRLSRRLESGERFPDPPPGLLEKLKSEIPNEVSVEPRLGSPEGKRSFSRRALPLAASVTALLGGGLLAIWLVRQPLPVPRDVLAPVVETLPAEAGDLEDTAALPVALDESFATRSLEIEEKEEPPGPGAPKKKEQGRLSAGSDEGLTLTTKEGTTVAEDKMANTKHVVGGLRENLAGPALERPVGEERLAKGPEADSRLRSGREKPDAAPMAVGVTSAVSASGPMKVSRDQVVPRPQEALLTATPCPGEPEGSCVIVVVDAKGSAPAIEPEVSQIRAMRELGSVGLEENAVEGTSLQGAQRLYRLELSRDIDPNAPLAKVQAPGPLEGQKALFPSDVAARWSDTPARVRLVILQALMDDKESSEVVLQEARQVALELPDDPEAQALGQRATRRLDSR